MVSRLAGRLIDRYAVDASHIFDPFSGSAAIPLAAHERGIRTTASDLNPIAELFYDVKVNGFDGGIARARLCEWIDRAQRARRGLPIEWSTKSYWFTDATLDKLERLRQVWHELQFPHSAETAAALLSVVLSIRLCSRADQRSPKPFISKRAKQDRRGRHFDPFAIATRIIAELEPLYPRRQNALPARFVRANVARDSFGRARLAPISHILTSPPYINAQDYYRNFKLELYFLEGIMPFQVADVREAFIGTDRGSLLHRIPKAALQRHRALFPGLLEIEARSGRLCAVIHRYLYDMERAFACMRRLVVPTGLLVVVCGDNLVAGRRVPTWKLLDRVIVQSGFVLRDRFADSIGDRLLAPKRHGHKGLIKREVISAYERLTDRDPFPSPQVERAHSDR
jgi:hypothetical protein